MARTARPIDRFAGYLEQAERSPLTIKNYRSDLQAFASWFEGTNGEPMEPAKVTRTTSGSSSAGWSHLAGVEGASP